MIDLPLRDRAARARIATELDENLLVEAGAGSGKTTALVGRMVALIATGAATVDEIAAVTFTRKAAGELRERFQIGIETALREAHEAEPSDDLVTDRLAGALDDIDRAFIGTIHSFCGRLLRERPLDVGLDPGFQELPVEERLVLRRRFWDSYLERLARDSDPILEELAVAGVPPSSLFGAFNHLVENPDVSFPADAIGAPTVGEVGNLRDELDGIVDTAWELMDEMPPPRGWDSLQKKLRQLHFEREITGWKEPADLFDAIALLCKSGRNGHSTTLSRWRDADMARSLKDRVNAFGFGPTPAQRLVDRWYAHRYALTIRLGLAAVSEFEAHRKRLAKLDFQDLLVLAARLLRENPGVRTQLGERYRRVLVDEFQDTDPLQAEIMLLLSSPPTEDDDWRTATPRPGALFVVGDPKQSIYRFRRADIQLYGFVRGRFAEFGEVVTLSTNFRSRPAIGDLVNGLFDDPEFFPETAIPEQAAFERLDTRPPVDPVPAEGVFWYDIGSDSGRKEGAATDDARRLASWIRERVDRRERVPGDFLILTRDRGQLDVYSRALEDYGLPLAVTGAGVGVEHELRELRVLLESMIDPTNPVKVVATLVGLFFGLDYERLVEHRLEGGSFDAMWPADRGHPDVVSAIARLNQWWRAASAEPADVFIGRLATELGLLPLAAAGELGTLRAGALVYALDALRASALAGDSSLPGALTALDAALGLKEAEAPLQPGRTDAVRLMNLHQAKGLEGTVVVLANPTEYGQRAPDIHLARSPTGEAEGFLRVSEAMGGYRGSRDVARPVGWVGHEATEARYEAAEEIRLLYVAVTRAREELVVARWPDGRGTSAWAPLDPWLLDHATELEMEVVDPPAREPLELSPAEAASAVERAGHVVRRGAEPTFRHTTVTDLTKTSGAQRGGHDSEKRGRTDRTALRGFAWGSAVHGALAAATAKPSEDALRSICRDLLVEHERPLDDHGEPIELRELLDLVRTVQTSDLWARSLAAEQSVAEVTFALPGVASPAHETEAESKATGTSSDGRPQLDLFGATVMAAAGEEAGSEDTSRDSESSRDASTKSRRTDAADQAIDGAVTVLEGVIDLAFREPDGWVIADYKTDVGTDPDFASREDAYRRQVDLYAEAWARLTGDIVKERVLFFTSQDRVERW